MKDLINDLQSPRRAVSTQKELGIRMAILPLENYGGDPEEAYLADGITEEIITNLARIKALHVISRRSVMRYKQSDEPLP